MVMAGKINKSLVAEAVKHGGRAVGISGADGNVLVAERKKKIVVVDERGGRGSWTEATRDRSRR